MKFIQVLLVIACVNAVAVGFISRRRRRSQPCVITHCAWHQWNPWTSCSIMCGSSVSETRTRTRYTATPAACGGDPCTGPNTETENCNKNGCNGHGVVLPVGCTCDSGYQGLCCEYEGPEPDPCSGYVEIDEEIRSTAYKTDLSLDPQYWLCDENMPQRWYRFTSGAGGRLATSENVPPPYHCGTQITLYMNGTHPTSNDVISLNACGDALGVVCFDHWPMKVKRCNDFYVYKLKRADGCPKAYCAGTELRCPIGENSPTGFTPGCTSAFPIIVSGPNLTSAVEEQVLNGHKVNAPVFQCTFETTLDSEQRDLFTVDWYADGVLVWTDNLTEYNSVNGIIKSNLTQFINPIVQNPGLFKLDQTIKCSVAAWFENIGVQSPRKYSLHIYAGIKADNDVIYLRENGPPVLVNMSNSIPIVCDDGVTKCCVDVGIVLENETALIEKCVVEFCNTDAIGTRKSLTLISTPDQQQSQDQTFILPFKQFDGGNPHYFRHQKPPSVTVHTRDQPSAFCHSTGDPHYNMFDSLSYDFFGTGEYVLVQGKGETGDVTHNFTVHARIKNCPAHLSEPSCNCGVAVREGSDVAIIDACNGAPQMTAYRNPTYCDPAFKISVSNDGREIRVNTGLGQRVRVVLIESEYIDIYVEVNGALFDSIEGLCGLYDGSPDNDLDYRDKETGEWLSDSCNGGYRCLPKNFPKAYRLDIGESLFYPTNWPKPDGDIPSYPICTCDPNTGGDPVINCTGIGDPISGYTDGAEWFTCEDVKLRSKTAFPTYSDDYIYDPYKFQYGLHDEATHSLRSPSWPTPSGITEEEATNKCTESIIASNIAESCENIERIRNSVDHYLSGCVYDIQVMDDYTFLGGVRSSLESACLFEFYSNVSLWEENDNGELAPPISIVNAVCPNHCSGHGECGMDGNCTCDDGYTGIDCSIEIGVPPIISEILSGNLCDISTRPCELVAIAATKIMNCDSLTCFIRDVWKPDNVQRTAALFQTAYTVYCPLPLTPIHRRSPTDDNTTATYQSLGISLSNDGILESNQVYLTIFDSKCMTCTDLNICSQKEDTCMISGKCYRANETNPDDRCMMCSPEVSTISWTKGVDPACKPTPEYEHSSDNNAWRTPTIFILCFVAVIVLICTIVIVIWINNKRGIYNIHIHCCGIQWKGSPSTKKTSQDDAITLQ